jgi:hypothetical protein
MHSTDPILRLMGMHVLPGVFFVVLSSELLFLWELRRLTSDANKTIRRWMLPASGLVLGILSIVLIMARFITVD